MRRGNDSAFRCPQCGAAANWAVDPCDVCGYESIADRTWRREARRRRGGDWGWWEWWHWWLVGDLIEALFWIGRLVVGLIRGLITSP